MKASLKLDHELLAVQSEHQVNAMLEITAPEGEQNADRTPLHLALVLDRSGSMAGPKLQHTQNAAAYLVNRLGPNDKLALVDYDDEVRLLASLGAATKQELLAAIASISPGGSTNLSGGWLKGLEEVGRGDENAVRKVLLLTDGLANVGITDPSELVELARNAAVHGTGTTTIGFGADFDEQLLTDMANAGLGNAHYIGAPEDAPGVFAQEFDDLVSLVAQNVSVEVRPTHEVKLLGVLNDYPQTSVLGGVQIQLGDAYAEETRRVVFELHIPDMAALGPVKVADVVLRYTTVGDQIEAHEVTLPLRVNIVHAGEVGSPDTDVIEEVTILKAARAQREARDLADRGDYGEAQARLQTFSTELRSLAEHSERAAELQFEADQIEASLGEMDPAQWDVAASKRAHYDVYRKQSGRRR
ncbi:MAG: vWA domain-containing protein [Actinomycetota bacterium]